MSEKPSSPSDVGAQAAPVAPPLLGAPGSAFRWLLPIAVCAGAFALTLFAVLLWPMSQAVLNEPDPAIHAVLADNFLLLQIRVWMVLLIAVLMGGAMAVAGARQNEKALVRLELRLLRIADGETELPPTISAKDFSQFDEVFSRLRAAMEGAARRHVGLLQRIQQSLGDLTQQLAAGNVASDEVRKSVNHVLREVEAALDAERRSRGKAQAAPGGWR